MALNQIKQEPESAESSSEDESLWSIKRRSEMNRNSEDSDNEPLLSNVLVTIEVEEVKEAQAFDFSMKPKPSTSKRKKIEKIEKNKKKEREFPCYICEAVFKSSQELKTHSWEHQVKTRHKCEECGRYFKKAFSLRLHSKVHMEKSLTCPVCDVKFAFKANLVRHIMTHEKMAECDICHEKFHTKTQLKKHVSSHPKQSGNEQSVEIKPCMVECKVEAVSDEDADNSPGNEVKNERNGSIESNDPNYNFENNTESNYEYVRRQDLPYQTQCSIVNKLYKGRTVDEISKMYNLTPEAVNEIWEERDKYMIHKKAGKKTLKYMNSILDARILEWFQNQKTNGVQVSGKMLQDVAEAFAKECGFIAFNGSKKWLDRFKKRYNICFRGTPTKRDYNGSVESKWKKIFFDEQWCDVRLGISDDDIYTGDEVGFYFNPSKGRIKKLAGRKFIQGYPKDRLAVFMCVNVPATDKKKLLVCGTEDPLVHSYRDPDTLPVTYIRHSQAHFTTQMFEEYVKYWNRELQLQNKKAILVLDRATIHSKLQLSHLKLVFVPWKAASGLMPMKNGISAAFRAEFRRLILEEKVMNVVRGVDRNITCLEALYMLDKAWIRTPSEIITNSFISTGYDVQPVQQQLHIVPKVTDNDEQMLCTMLKDYDVESYYADLPNLDMFLTVDEELLTGQGTNGSVFGGNHRVVDPATTEREKEDILPLATEKPGTNDTELRVKKLRALEDLEIVRKYLMSSATPYNIYCNLMEIEKFVMQEPVSFE